ncbi:MAG: HD domain-containing protein [Oscillospiraceae bacterium]|nr:HD domain-containing protein [Oscillospiraceae bacterium]
MPYQDQITQIDPMAAVRAVSETLRRMDPRLVEHGDRVAFLACALGELSGERIDDRKLFLLSVFHDIGAYKTEEIDRMLDFETKNVIDHTIYGYLFLKHMTPLRGEAEAILYHHSSYRALAQLRPEIAAYAALIHLADRLDIAFLHGKDAAALRHSEAGLFYQPYVALAEQNVPQLFAQLADGSYRQKNWDRVSRYRLSARETVDYLKMLVFSIDFRSEHTVTHTINTVSIALDIAKRFGLNKKEQEKIYLGALLHDVGKVAVPVEILESPGRLTPEQMAIMRTHVVETERLIHGVIPEEICRLAVRHHEKLDGTGYPYGLKGAALTLPERIVAVADIVSALSSRRSYKEPFPQEKTVAILREMETEKLDRDVCDYVCDCYDTIMQTTDGARSDVVRRYQAIKAEFETRKGMAAPQ